MKTILCFGDSITWGFDASSFKRFDINTRWPGAMKNALGNTFHVIEEGLNGRTTVFADEFTPRQALGAGSHVLPMLLDSHSPLDLIIIMLGTNDLQTHRNATARMAARGCSALITQVYESVAGVDGSPPKILLVSPPPFVKVQGFMEVIFGPEIEESQQLAHYYRMTAETFNTEFFDAGSVVTSSSVDGIHLEADQEIKLGQALAEKVRGIFSNLA